MKKKGLGLLLAFCLGIGISSTTVLADTFHGERAITSDITTVVDENGNISEVSEESGIVEDDGVMTLTETTKVVNFNIKTSGAVTEYTEEVTGTSGYTYGGYAADAAYLGMTSDGKIRFMLAGVIGKVNATEVQIVDKANVQALSHYYVSGGRLKHRIITNLNSSTSGSNLDNGPAPSYLKEGVKYYSYDGHYFYTEDKFENMLEDYNAKTRVNSINASNPFYNYFQYLPFRSKTNYSISDINAMLDKRVQETSKMRDIGEALVTNQNTYGTNALLMTGVAANESAWGMSSIALNKNNLFGLNAIDSSPGQSANYFESVSQCIKEYSERWLSKEYLNPSNWKYFGGFLGNKASGLNVKYASDPYWGEKAAAMAWNLDRENGNKDAKKYTLAIKDMIGPDNVVNIRNQSATTSAVLYKTPKAGSCSYIVLKETPENNFYKIQSDGVLNNGRTGLDGSTGIYDFGSMYAYLSVDYLEIVSKGTNIEPEPTPIPSWSVKGVKTNVASPQAFNTSIKLSADIAGDKTELQYKFVWMKDNWKEWGILKDFSDMDSTIWKPDKGGDYYLYLDVRDKVGKVVTVKIPYQIKSWNNTSVQTSVEAPRSLNSQITLSANIAGDTSGLKYKFVWMKDNWKEWGILQDFSSVNNFTWKPNKVGNYKIYVDVKDSQGHMITKTKEYKIVEKSWEFDELEFEPELAEIGNDVNLVQNIKKITEEKTNLQYKFVWMKDNWKEWGIIRDFTTNNSVIWKPEIIGECKIYVDIKDDKGNIETRKVSYTVKSGTWKYSNIVSDQLSPQVVNQKIKLKVNLTGNTYGLKYKFVWMKDNWKEWGVIRDFTEQSSVEWIPKKSGDYMIYADILDYTGKMFTFKTAFQVKTWNYDMVQISPNMTQNVGAKITIKPIVRGDLSKINYKYVWMRDNWKEWGIIKDFSSSNSVTWIPKTSGEYKLYVDVKYGNEKYITKIVPISVGMWDYKSINITKKSSNSYEIQPIIEGNKNGFTYKYVWMKDNWEEWGIISQFSSSQIMQWSPQTKGKYMIYVDVKDALGNIITVKREYNVQ